MTAVASSDTEHAHDPRAAVEHLLPLLESAAVTYFPIRHHSPACAAHVQRWIQTHRPASVLIEGPESFSTLTGFLADERCRPPIAVYVNFVDRQKRLRKVDPLAQDKPSGPPSSPDRFAGFYPFCDYSPELVALRTGHAVGANIRFIDLEFPEKILASRGDDDPPELDEENQQPQPANKKIPVIRMESLASDPHLEHSTYTRELARRMGCRNFDELWDHLFEAHWDADDTTGFMRRVAAYCTMSRLAYEPRQLEVDGTNAREACMAAAIRDELAKNRQAGKTGPILVVTGGFHTVALPGLVARDTRRPKPVRFDEHETGTWLMRYSFNQLDALAGYGAGMPSPAFYDRMWLATMAADATHHSRDAARTTTAIEILVEIGRLTRERNLPTAISTPDAIAAAQMARQLAELRGHDWPQREDVLDGVRSCFIKGQMDGEGRVLMNLVTQVLAGDRVGQLPPGTGVPPIVDDFRDQARRLKLSLDSILSREVVLDLYRKPQHRETSRLFHRLNLLNAPFAEFLGGPDFVNGIGLELMQEHWQVAWSPNTESQLIEASVYGATILEAAMTKLQEQIAEMQTDGTQRNTAAAVQMLIRACRLGLHAQTPVLVQLIDQQIAEDPLLPTVVDGLTQLELLQHSREPLEATNLTAIPHLTAAAYQRACRLAAETVICPDEMINPVINALRALREVLAGQRSRVPGPKPGAQTETGSETMVSDPLEEPRLDPVLFTQALRSIIAHPPDKAQAPIVGAAAGLLYGEGVLSATELVALTSGYLSGSLVDPRRSCGIVRGLLATAREVAWHVTEILQSLDTQFGGWDEETFLKSLPELRLAFSDLTPREITRVADNVASLHGKQTLGDLVHMDLDEEEVQVALRLNQLVRAALHEDGLAGDGAAQP